MQIDLSEVMTDLEGNPLKKDDKDLTVGMALGQVLTAGTSPDPLRAYVLAKKLVGEEGVKEIDLAEVDYLKKAIEDNQTYLVIVKGQLLSKFVQGSEKAPEASEEPKAE